MLLPLPLEDSRIDRPWASFLGRFSACFKSCFRSLSTTALLPKPLPLIGGEVFFGVFEFPAQPSGNQALGPSALGDARHCLAGIGERALHNQIPINIPINTEQRLQVINDCPPSGRRLGSSPQYCFLPYPQLSGSLQHRQAAPPASGRNRRHLRCCFRALSCQATGR